MPRTKRVARPSKAPVKSKLSKQQAIEAEAINNKATEMMESLLTRINEAEKGDLEALRAFKAHVVLQIPRFLMDKTVGEIIAGEVSSQTTISSTMSSDSSHAANSTRTISTTKGKPTGSRTNSATRIASSILKSSASTRSESRKRSLSAANDPSSERSHMITSTTSSTGATGRRSRTRTVTNTGTKPISRSLSRTAQKNTATTVYKTPAGKGPNLGQGYITPKCKPNTPQILMRRPKQGEVAISYGGSPLLTGSSTREDVANINIPLPNGDLLSLLPQSGLRPSLIPQVDSHTRRELEILRDNLIKVCNVMK